MNVSKSALKRAMTPIQRKRLLSAAAAIATERQDKTIEGWKEEESDYKRDHDEGKEEREDEEQRLDSETGQTIPSKESGEISSQALCMSKH